MAKCRKNVENFLDACRKIGVGKVKQQYNLVFIYCFQFLSIQTAVYLEFNHVYSESVFYILLQVSIVINLIYLYLSQHMYIFGIFRLKIYFFLTLRFLFVCVILNIFLTCCFQIFKQNCICRFSLIDFNLLYCYRSNSVFKKTKQEHNYSFGCF